ncbi:MAG: iron-containing alcohol dehydrogenase family protein [Terrimicrobiaceae bacterium]|nr:iron-containing alcohol dehydrogenase family protein [Terrimicrobiaceae bacterium]
MNDARLAAIPTLVRIKPGALARIGVYCHRHGFRTASLWVSEGLDTRIVGQAIQSLGHHGIPVVEQCEVTTIDQVTIEQMSSADGGDILIGLGGGKAIDAAKLAAHRRGRPFLAIPTSLSNDGFGSPQASILVEGRRRSVPATMPFGVVVDTAVCLGAPDILWLSGVGDLSAKFTAIADWKLAFHETGEPVDDFAALMADGTFYQLLARPEHDLEGVRLLASALLLSGIAMSICGSSRPASGSEHLISHAFDLIATRPRLHGLQVGLATAICARLQGRDTSDLDCLFERTGFWDALRREPFPTAEWLEACRIAPTLKENFHTILSTRDRLPEIEEMITTDPVFDAVFA